MPTSAHGSSGAAQRGFTLVELLVVVAIVALTTTLVALALRDSRAQALEREADRLVLLLETARAQSRASGLAVWWRPVAATEAGGFRFVGLRAAQALPEHWLDAEVAAEIDGAALLELGPEALIGAQRVWLRLGERRIAVATDGLMPFAAQAGP